MDDNNNVIIVESAIKSDLSLNYLKKLIIDILHENNVYISSIKKDGFYYVIELKKSNEIVFTMDLLSKVSGISYIFIAKPLVVDYDVLSKMVIQIWKEILLPGEKFYIIITLSDENNFKKNEFVFFRKDLEFFIISELSSFSIDLKNVRNEIEADKILYILIGNDFAYVSLLLKRCKELMPFKFLNEKVICPLYNEFSFLSFISILDNGFFPFPVFFYSSRNQLIKILKSFDKIIKRYPIRLIDINLINLEKVNLDLTRSLSKNNDDYSDVQKKMVYELIMEEIIVLILLQMKKVDLNFICLSFSPFFHPLWFIKKNVQLSFESGKIPLTPFLFNYDFKYNLKDFYKINNSMDVEQPLNSTLSFLDIEQKNYNLIFQKFVDTSKLPSTNEIIKFNLDMRKDDVLDILDSI
ncbi:MAG TPA: hypothetical protein VN703_06155 [Candidatus Sulfopaludibacter sp.]|nr:hypothetical protein [Candidatus Sulfopaludibacter sp.]